MKPLSEVAPGLLVIQIPIQAMRGVRILAMVEITKKIHISQIFSMDLQFGPFWQSGERVVGFLTFSWAKQLKFLSIVVSTLKS